MRRKHSIRSIFASPINVSVQLLRNLYAYYSKPINAYANEYLSSYIDMFIRFALATFFGAFILGAAFSYNNQLSILPEFSNIPPAVGTPLIAGVFALIVAAMQINSNKRSAKETIATKVSEIELVKYRDELAIHEKNSDKRLLRLEKEQESLSAQRDLLAKLRRISLQLETSNSQELTDIRDVLVESYEEAYRLSLISIATDIEKIIKQIKNAGTCEPSLVETLKNNAGSRYQEVLASIENINETIWEIDAGLADKRKTYSEIVRSLPADPRGRRHWFR